MQDTRDPGGTLKAMALAGVHRTSEAIAAASRKRDEAIEIALDLGAVKDDFDRALERDIGSTTGPGLSMALTYYRNASQALAREVEAHSALVQLAADHGASSDEIEARKVRHERAHIDIPVRRLMGRRLLGLRPAAPLWQVVLLSAALIVVFAVAVAVASILASFIVIGAAMSANRTLGRGGKSLSRQWFQQLRSGPRWWY